MIAMSVVAKTRGASYVVSDGEHLLDHKVMRFTGRKRRERILEYILNLIELGDIEIVYLGDPRGKEDSEGASFLDELRVHLMGREIAHEIVGRDQLDARFKGVSRYAVAELLAAEIPELRGYLPKKKRLWESEDASMLLFDSAAILRVKGLL